MLNDKQIPLSLASVLDPAHHADPYPLYAQIRAKHPVYWDEGIGAWLLTRFADVVAALHDPRLSAKRVIIDATWFPAEFQDLVVPPIRALARQMIFCDPPDHTRLRLLWSRACGPQHIAAMRARIQYLTDALLNVAHVG